MQIKPRLVAGFSAGPDDTVYVCDTCGRIQAVSVWGYVQDTGAGKVSSVKVKDLDPDHYNRLYRSDLPGFMRVEEHTAQINYKKDVSFKEILNPVRFMS